MSAGEPHELPVNLEDLFYKYSSYVAFITHRMVGDPAEVDDLIQEVFIDAQKGLAGLNDPGAVKGWLGTITVRRVNRHLQKRRFLRFVGLDRVPAYESIADRAASPEQRAMIASIYKILDEFPAKERIPWTLKYIQGEDVTEIARLCGCSRATAHRRIAAVQAVVSEAHQEDWE